jgi:hypothetical protein
VKGVISAMAVSLARLAFLLDVGDFTAGREFPVLTDNAAAGQGGKPEKPDETHRTVLLSNGTANSMPNSSVFHSCSPNTSDEREQPSKLGVARRGVRCRRSDATRIAAVIWTIG